MIKIAILGATSHIAKGLIFSFLNNTNYSLYLFARDTSSVNFFLESNSLISGEIEVLIFDRFFDHHYDVIINCIGIADPGKLKDSGSSIIFVTETFDNMILDYLKERKEALYINFSSGAVYGTAFNKPVDYSSLSGIHVNEITEKDYYRLAKLYSEAKHRSLKEFNIIDLRVFSYFSRYIDLNTKFLMTDIVNAIINDDIFVTTDENIVRDYVHLDDLFGLINCCITKKNINDVFDVYSREPIEKFELLKVLNKEFGLKFIIENSISLVNATGSKSVYFSENKHASIIGYEPFYSSVDTILFEIEKVLNY
ncbi:MAG: epimerase [Spirochaetae bacterium HGW-Spirochaetae-5]|nr:MAG: epimerase [Spirochaetae bacterium HGW-Spirochaetae-5]